MLGILAGYGVHGMRKTCGRASNYATSNPWALIRADGTLQDSRFSLNLLDYERSLWPPETLACFVPRAVATCCPVNGTEKKKSRRRSSTVWTLIS